MMLYICKLFNNDAQTLRKFLFSFPSDCFYRPVYFDKDTDSKPRLLRFVYDALRDNSDKHMLIMAIFWLYPMNLMFNKTRNLYIT